MEIEQYKVIDNVENNIDLDGIFSLMEKNDKAFFDLIEQNDYEEAGKIASFQKKLYEKAQGSDFKSRDWDFQSKIEIFNCCAIEFLKQHPLKNN